MTWFAAQRRYDDYDRTHDYDGRLGDQVEDGAE